MLAFLPSRPLYYCCYTFNLYGYYKLHNTLLLFLFKHSILFLRDWSMEKSMKYGGGKKALDSPTFGLPDQWDPSLIFKPRFCRLSVTCRQIPLNWCLPLPYIAQFLRLIWFLFFWKRKDDILRRAVAVRAGGIPMTNHPLRDFSREWHSLSRVVGSHRILQALPLHIRAISQTMALQKLCW